MAPHTLVGALAGVSLLALAQVATAQDHSHHSAAPAADPHAGHDMADMPAASHAPAHAMTSPYGPWPMSRDASG
ncbi:MAG: hypothetical protein EPO54_02060, partial [Brevundimonas sp.]